MRCSIAHFTKKVIQMDRVELSTEISHVKKLSRRVIQKLFYPNLVLPILPDFITDVPPCLSYVIVWRHFFDIKWG